MGRYRGYWWSPDGDIDRRVSRRRRRRSPQWVIADPADAGRSRQDDPLPGRRHRQRGWSRCTSSASTDASVEVDWDREFFPYIATVDWTDAGLLVIGRVARPAGLDDAARSMPTTGETTVVAHDYDDAWVELVPGLPRLLTDGRVVTAADRDGAAPPVRRRHAGHPARPPGARRAELAQRTRRRSWPTRSPTPRNSTSGGGTMRRSSPPSPPSPASTPPRSGDRRPSSVRRRSDEPGARVVTARPDTDRQSFAERPLVTPERRDLRRRRTRHRHRGPAAARPRRFAAAGPARPVRRPARARGSQQLVQRVPRPRSGSPIRASRSSSPTGAARPDAATRGSVRSISIWPTALLDDQIDALARRRRAVPRVFDLGRVAIRGWSFGGYLAALAVLRRPDVFHAAVAGAPVTEWRLYDTYYTERYLGDPDDRRRTATTRAHCSRCSPS